MHGISTELRDDDSLKDRSAIAAHKDCGMRDGHIAERLAKRLL